jgi:CHAT domain-containing protein/Tfp pilus assembly protein PilF
LNRALEIRRALSSVDPELVVALELRGDLLWLTGETKGARDGWNEALALGERTLRPEHPTLAAIQRRIALASDAIGDRTDARLRRELSLGIAERSLAPCSPEMAAVLGDLATSIRYDGDFRQAQRLYQRALDLSERCRGKNDSATATIQHNMAILAAEIGDYEEALRLHERAVRAWTTTLGPHHPYVARGLNALASVLAAHGQTARARELYSRALALRRAALGPDHPDVATTIANLAQLSAGTGDLATAQRLASQAVDIYRRVGPSSGPDHLARVLQLQGDMEIRLGHFQSARKTLGEALLVREEVFGSDHPLVAESRSSLASVEFASGSYEASVTAALDAERAGRDHLQFTARYLPERQAMAYAAKRPKGLDIALSVVAAGHVSDPSLVYESVIQSRGVILDELAARARETTTSDPELASLNAALVNARQRFANVMLRSLQGEESVPRTLLDEVRRQKEAAESALAERSAAARADVARAHVTLDDLRRALPPDSALVSFVRYDRAVVSRTGARAQIRTVPSYIAFVIRTDATTVDAIPLGAATAVDAAVSQWHDQAAGQSIAAGVDPTEAEVAYRTVGTALRQRVWDPIARHLGSVSHVLIAPDGPLNLVSFATLPAGVHGYLAEQSRTIHYVSTERDVIPIARAESSGGLLAVGNAAFDRRPPRANALARTTTDLRGSSCSSLKAMHFESLPGSRAEIADIARLWSRNEAAVPTILTGNAATETAFKEAVAGRQVIHLATHGFFLGPECDATVVHTRSVGGLTSGTLGLAQSVENPLLLSGLALSGANNYLSATSFEDDGILTAEEVASLNLQGTDWAVLSACDTGMGEVKTGEGVFGLRRAFQIAGARTVIMSLWAVEDQTAGQWMRLLYQGRLEKHLSTLDAVHDATLSFLRARRARGQSTHPFYWGGFVAAGDWR